jgi:hypothetical protein
MTTTVMRAQETTKMIASTLQAASTDDDKIFQDTLNKQKINMFATLEDMDPLHQRIRAKIR